jgi:hypothetical protein
MITVPAWAVFAISPQRSTTTEISTLTCGQRNTGTRRCNGLTTIVIVVCHGKASDIGGRLTGGPPRPNAFNDVPT